MLPKTIRTMGMAVGLALLVASPANAATTFSGLIDGNTFNSPFSFSNSSDAGETIVSISFDLSGAAAAPICFDTEAGGGCNPGGGGTAVPFTPLGGSEVSTGASETVVDGGTTLDLTFADFDPGESLSFIIDLDRVAGNVGVLGNDLIGATVLAMFSDGSSLMGVFEAIAGNADAAEFSVSGSIPTIPVPAGLPLLLTALGGLGFLVRRREWT